MVLAGLKMRSADYADFSAPYNAPACVTDDLGAKHQSIAGITSTNIGQ
jgi:hypothetical protein